MFVKLNFVLEPSIWLFSFYFDDGLSFICYVIKISFHKPTCVGNWPGNILYGRANKLDVKNFQQIIPLIK